MSPRNLEVKFHRCSAPNVSDVETQAQTELSSAVSQRPLPLVSSELSEYQADVPRSSLARMRRRSTAHPQAVSQELDDLETEIDTTETFSITEHLTEASLQSDDYNDSCDAAPDCSNGDEGKQSFNGMPLNVPITTPVEGGHGMIDVEADQGPRHSMLPLMKYHHPIEMEIDFQGEGEYRNHNLPGRVNEDGRGYSCGDELEGTESEGKVHANMDVMIPGDAKKVVRTFSTTSKWSSNMLLNVWNVLAGHPHPLPHPDMVGLVV